MTTFCEDRRLSIPKPFLCSADDIIGNLASLLRSINSVQTSTPTSQFYVWSPAEQLLLQAHIINAALTSSASNDDIRLCIGALAQGASLLQTTFQPLLLSGALLGFLSKGKRIKAEHKACLERLGLSTEGTVDVLRKRIDTEIRRIQQESTGPGQEDRRRKELGQLPRVVVLKREIDRQLALPIPGYWDLPECISILLPSQEACPSDEDIFAAYKRADEDGLIDELLLRRNRSILLVLKEFRRRTTSVVGNSLLVNEAKILSTHFMDICKETHIRKLFFMQQVCRCHIWKLILR